MTKTALVTGATSGIGKATAQILAKNNYKIIPDIGLTSSMSVTPSYDESHYFSLNQKIEAIIH